MDYLSHLNGKIDFSYLNKINQSQSDQWEKGHGPRLKDILDQISVSHSKGFSIDQGVVSFKAESTANLQDLLIGLKSWRKGPFKINDIEIESEWRSDFKWNRLNSHISPLKDRVILDIGANNGYFMFRMLEHNPKLVLGLEPTLIYKAQFEALKKFHPVENLQLETWGVEHLQAFESVFDTIFSMGILYHHRSPLDQLKDMRRALKPGGELVLETIGIPGEEIKSITPKDRYAGMRNVWFLPTLSQLIVWLERSKFNEIEVISKDWQEDREQRATSWSGEVSYKNFLNPKDSSLTIEGLAAPKRFLLKASRK